MEAPASIKKCKSKFWENKFRKKNAFKLFCCKGTPYLWDFAFSAEFLLRIMLSSTARSPPRTTPFVGGTGQLRQSSLDRVHICPISGRSFGRAFSGALVRVPQKEVGKRSSIPFFVFATFLVTFSDASVTLFVALCQTPFAGLLLRQGELGRTPCEVLCFIACQKAHFP